MILILAALAALGAACGFLVYRHATSASVPHAPVWGLFAFLTAGLGTLGYVLVGRHQAPPTIVSMRDRLPNIGERAAAPRQDPLGVRPAARREVPAVQLPPDPWGLEPDRSVAPLLSKPARSRRSGEAPADHPGRLAEPRS
jgi:hypothetical protein